MSDKKELRKRLRAKLANKKNARTSLGNRQDIPQGTENLNEMRASKNPMQRKQFQDMMKQFAENEKLNADPTVFMNKVLERMKDKIEAYNNSSSTSVTDSVPVSEAVQPVSGIMQPVSVQPGLMQPATTVQAPTVTEITEQEADKIFLEGKANETNADDHDSNSVSSNLDD